MYVQCSALLFQRTIVDAWQLYLTFSAIAGFGHSLSSFAALSLMPLWFDSRLGLAVGIANSATALAPLLVGPLAPSILQSIGWRRALLCLALIDGVVLMASFFF